MNPQDARDLFETLKLLTDLISQRPSEWLPVYAAIGGAFVGAIASFFPILIVETYKNRMESHQIQASIIAEIAALVEVMEARGYLGSLKNIVEQFNAKPELTSYSISVDVPSHYSRIYQGNCSRIGLICSNTAVKIVRFHQLIDAVVQDVKPGGVLSRGAEKKAFIEAIAILEQALEIGEELKTGVYR